RAADGHAGNRAGAAFDQAAALRLADDIVADFDGPHVADAEDLAAVLARAAAQRAADVGRADAVGPDVGADDIALRIERGERAGDGAEQIPRARRSAEPPDRVRIEALHADG